MTDNANRKQKTPIPINDDRLQAVYRANSSNIIYT